ncbi:angiopoietin-related protein 3-like isoform X2 [Anastrepha obliqua]|uniref:angiopoietin-related protein 3-like isoform X2 n=1 Tax=Anastrepha obliqua TaxID=95512 RepID=UPI002409C49C|nr:angiopoietin-related protein 3-like isoform X2 [Anastrepha obliqua]
MTLRSVYFVPILISALILTDIGISAIEEGDSFTLLFGSERLLENLLHEVTSIKDSLIAESQRSLNTLLEDNRNIRNIVMTTKRDLMRQNQETRMRMEKFISDELETHKIRQQGIDLETIEHAMKSQRDWFTKEIQLFEGKLLNKIQDNQQLRNAQQNMNEKTQYEKLETQIKEFAEQLKQTTASFEQAHNEIKHSFNQSNEILTECLSKTENPNDFSYQDFLPNATAEVVKVNSKPLGKRSASCDEAINSNTVEKNGGVYALEITERSLTMPAYCLPDPNKGKAWLVIQRRIDETLSFDLEWNEYKNGFGNLNGNFFIGLEAIHKMMLPNKNTELWIQLGISTGESPYEFYKDFVISAGNKTYKLMSVHGAEGTAGDELTSLTGQVFIHKYIHTILWKTCAKRLLAGWWYPGDGISCGTGNLNRNFEDITWGDWNHIIYTHMAIRHTDKPVKNT